MKALMRTVAKATLLSVLAVFIFSAVCSVAGVRINSTRSIPLGLYLTTSAPVEKGQYVTFCPPENSIFAEAKKRGYIGAGFCPGGYGLMMKKILAAKNDAVFVSENGVLVNGKLLPLSAPIKVDGAGRALPHYNKQQYTVNESDILLMSDVSAISFDGRYFGPVSQSQIQAVIRPIFTW